MGKLCKKQFPHNCLVCFDHGVIWLDNNKYICGRYKAGKIYDETDQCIGTYTGDSPCSLNETDPSFYIKGNYIYKNSSPFVRFEGDSEGACIAAFLYDKYLEADGYWTFNELFQNTYAQGTGFVKALIVITFLLSVYAFSQLPNTISYIFAQGGVAILLFCIWLGAFLYGITRKTFPLCQNIHDFADYVLRLLVPYLHVFWIVLAAVCIIALLYGYFSFSYLAFIIRYLPAATVLLTVPFYFINLSWSLYLLYKLSP